MRYKPTDIPANIANQSYGRRENKNLVKPTDKRYSDSTSVDIIFFVFLLNLRTTSLETVVVKVVECPTRLLMTFSRHPCLRANPSMGRPATR